MEVVKNNHPPQRNKISPLQEVDTFWVFGRMEDERWYLLIISYLRRLIMGGGAVCQPFALLTNKQKE